MTTEAVAAGFYESPNGKKYPRLQLLTVAGLLDGTQRALRPDHEPELGYKKAKAEASGEQATLLWSGGRVVALQRWQARLQPGPGSCTFRTLLISAATRGIDCAHPILVCRNPFHGYR